MQEVMDTDKRRHAAELIQATLYKVQSGKPASSQEPALCRVQVCISFNIGPKGWSIYNHNPNLYDLFLSHCMSRQSMHRRAAVLHTFVILGQERPPQSYLSH